MRLGKLVIHSPSALADLCKSVGFYTTFWQMSSYDLAPPLERYQEEVNAFRNLANQEDRKYQSSRHSPAAASMHRKLRERYQRTVENLTRELKEHTVSRTFTLKRLVREKQKWFMGNRMCHK